VNLWGKRAIRRNIRFGLAGRPTFRLEDRGREYSALASTRWGFFGGKAEL
jgi:hypothetical protein